MKKFSFNSITRKKPPKGVLWGHLEISALASRHQHRHWNRYWHQHCKKFIFAFRIFFFKYNICVLSSALLWHQYHFATNTYFFTISFSSIQKRSLEFSKKAIWTFGSTHPLVFWKITAPKISGYFAYFSAKHPGWSSFWVHSQACLGFFQKAF